MTTFPPPAVTKLAQTIAGHVQKLALHTQQITTLQTTTAQQSTQIGTAQTTANAANTAAAAAQTTANSATSGLAALPNWLSGSTKCATVDSISDTGVTASEVNDVVTAIIHSLKNAGHMA